MNNLNVVIVKEKASHCKQSAALNHIRTNQQEQSSEL